MKLPTYWVIVISQRITGFPIIEYWLRYAEQSGGEAVALEVGDEVVVPEPPPVEPLDVGDSVEVVDEDVGEDVAELLAVDVSVAVVKLRADAVADVEESWAISAK
jgi:hypothetical protein